MISLRSQELHAYMHFLAEMGELLYQLGCVVGVLTVELPGAAGGADDR